MRQTGGRGMRSAGVFVALLALVASLAIPAAAFATTPVPTIRLSTTYQPVAAKFRVTGYVGKAYAGKSVTVQIKKPGRSYWSNMATRTVNKYGTYSYYYTPKLAGKFYIHTKFSTRFSRTAALYVKKGPGVKSVILLASTTSTRDSGLFERIGPAFLAACPEYKIEATFVGSGAAIALGGTGDADVLLTHSPAAEKNFMNGLVGTPLAASAYKGKSRYKVMYNDYILVGPNANPAGIAVGDPAITAFSKIASTTATFWSRNDNSGTNAKEKSIWAMLGNPQTGQSWYSASGVMGMAQALATSNDAGGYTLSDRATWLTWRNLQPTVNIKIVNEGDSTYFNQYSVIEVAGARNWEGAQDFSQWIRSPQAQELIRTYGEYTFPGQAMFVPNQGVYPNGGK